MNASPEPSSRTFSTLALSVAVAAISPPACGRLGDGLFCDDTTCGFSSETWSRLQELANPGPPPRDPSNKWADDDAAATLGQAFFFDPRFSGNATQVDAIGRAAAVPRAPKGQPVNVSCASCHDLNHMGVDVASRPGNVSSGAGWTDVNALSVVNSAYSNLVFWNGRADSLWALAAAVAESGTTMNGNRLHTAWVINDYYRADWSNLFKDDEAATLPMAPSNTQCTVSVIVEKTGPRAGQCIQQNGVCPPGICAQVIGTDGMTGCWPNPALGLIPLNGKKGTIDGCQPGDAREPFGDAYDCLDEALRGRVDRVLVLWAKVLEAYQRRLNNPKVYDQTGKRWLVTPFDDWIDAGPRSTIVSEAARRGAQLFVGRASCVDCHDGPMFSDGRFHNVGVAQVGPDVPTLADCPDGSKTCDCVKGDKCLPWGQYDGLKRLKASAFLRIGKFSDDPSDTSRLAAENPPLAESMKGAWRTPSLRNVALTAPYMHDGRYATLEEVVDHYNRGGDVDSVGTRDVHIKPLGLTDRERADLIEFLKTLTGPPLDPALRTAPDLSPTLVCP